MNPLAPITALILVSLPCAAATYYVDATRGSDTSPGTNIAALWKTLAKVSATEFKPGDRILLRAASVWHEQLAPRLNAMMTAEFGTIPRSP